jgi:hypothetical protein
MTSAIFYNSIFFTFLVLNRINLTNSPTAHAKDKTEKVCTSTAHVLSHLVQDFSAVAPSLKAAQTTA